MKKIFSILLLSLMLLSCNPNATAWKTTATVREVAFQMEAALALAARDKSKECLQKHKAKEAPEYATCIKAHVDALKDWIQYGRPAVNSALVLTVSAIQIAENTKTKVQWLDYLKPALCGLSRAMQQWGHLLPISVKTQVLGVSRLATNVTCDQK